MFKRFLLVLMVFVLIAPLVALDIELSAAPAHAASADRECNDGGATLAKRVSTCMNGTDGVPVRGYSVDDCLRQVYASGPNSSVIPEFERSTCSKNGRYIQAERIAQTRFIQWLDARNRVAWGDYMQVALPPGENLIHPGAQWEVTTSNGKRADVINYEPEYNYWNSTPATTEMELWELKTSAYFPMKAIAESQARRQAEGYIEQFKEDSLVDPEDADAGSRWNALTLGDNSGYTDRFVVKARTCRDNPKATYERHYDYSVSDGGDGVLIADRTIRDYRCTPSRERETTQHREQPAYGLQFWEVGPGGELGDQADRYLVVLRDVCNAIGCTNLPIPIPLPVRIPIPIRVPVPLISAALLKFDVAGQDAWSMKSEEFCDEVATLELASGGTSTPFADFCRTSSSFPALVNDPDFLQFLQALDSVSYSTLMALIVVWVHDDAGDNVSTPARVTGDPHLVTLDGLDYDMQSVGEFELLSVPDREIEVQARFTAAGTQSSVTAVATQWADTNVELRADGSILFNGEAATVAPGTGYSLGEDELGYLFNDNGTYRMSWEPDDPDAEPVTLTWQPISPGLGGFGVQVPPGVPTEGLLGDNNGDPLDDLRLSTGEPVDAQDAVAIHDEYADSWRLSDHFSFFTYAAGQSTATFTDQSFPQEIVTLGDFSAADQANAQQVCESTGVLSGPSFRNCMLDVLVTQNNDFAAAFAGVQDAVRSAGDKVMSATGHVTETFNVATIAPNFSPLRTTTDSGFGSVAGPHQEAEQFRFYVPSLPKHDQVQIEFDVIAIGQWDAADAVGVRIDGQPTQILDLSGAVLGAANNGDPLRTKRISLPVDHHRDLVTVALAGSGLQGGQSFAVDNVAVSARIVAAQKFSPVLSPGVSVPLRAPSIGGGAGELESWGAEDRYDLLLLGQDVLLDWQTQSSTVKWALSDADDVVVGGGLSSDGNTRLRDLDGSYELLIESAGDSPPSSEVYSLDLLVTPEAQEFAFELPGPVRLPADLPSPAFANGAGSLETKLSKDVYAFTVSGSAETIVVDPTICPRETYRARLSWILVDEDNTPVASGSCREQTVEGLDAGDYELRVEPERETTGSYEIVVTQGGPRASFSIPPASASNLRTQTWSFEGDDDTAGFECALDAPSYAGPFTVCSSPVVFSDLPDGDHAIRIRATDGDGDPGPALSHVVTVDTAAPDVEITRKPPTVSNINGPVFEYTAAKRGMSYQCSLVPVGTAPDYVDCDGASVYRDLAHGTYRFTVLGTDWVGNEGTITYDFMVDLEPPAITLTPPTNVTSTISPLFAFTANESATFECSLVPLAEPDAFSPCTSPKQYAGLTDGTQYRFIVKATDVAGQWSSRGITWTPYSVPPTVTMTTKPAGSSSNAAPSFAFSSNISNPTFECSLELSSVASVFSACTSPKTYSGKAPGAYMFTVKAIDPSGSWVSSSYQFSITAPSGDTQAPTTPGTPTAVIAPSGSSIGSDTDTPATGIPLRISWSGSTDNVGVSGYQLWYSSNGGAYVNAGNVAGLSVNMNVPPGTTSWRFQMRAYDQAGNTSSATAASPAVVVAVEQETASSRLTYAGTWSSASAAPSSGGATQYASTTSASATFKPATGAVQVAVFMATGPAAGRATLSVDGAAATTIDLYAATAGHRRIILSTSALSATVAHTIVIKPAGTKNAASSSTRVDLDGFVVRR